MATIDELESLLASLPDEQKHAIFRFLEGQLQNAAKPTLPSGTHGVLDIAPVRLGPVLRPLNGDDDLLDEMLEERADPEELKMHAAEVHERAGRNFLDGGDYAEAIKAFQRAQEKYPAGAGRLHFHLAQVYARQGLLGEALGALDNYLAMMPQGTDAYEMKIALLQKSRVSRGTNSSTSRQVLSQSA